MNHCMFLQNNLEKRENVDYMSPSIQATNGRYGKTKNERTHVSIAWK
jgi:hypothetical protein